MRVCEMSDEIREQLSALADDELSDVERPLLLGRLQRDAGLRARLGRYQLIGEVMRGAQTTGTLDIADRVSEALADDAALSRAAMTDRPVWWKPLAGIAVAASVAVVAVLSITALQNTGGPGEAVPELAASGSPVPVVPENAVARVSETAGDQWERIEPQIDKRLSGYLVNHNEYAASRGVQSVMPYVRIVGHNADE